MKAIVQLIFSSIALAVVIAIIALNPGCATTATAQPAGGPTRTATPVAGEETVDVGRGDPTLLEVLRFARQTGSEVEIQDKEETWVAGKTLTTKESKPTPSSKKSGGVIFTKTVRIPTIVVFEQCMPEVEAMDLGERTATDNLVEWIEQVLVKANCEVGRHIVLTTTEEVSTSSEHGEFCVTIPRSAIRVHCNVTGAGMDDNEAIH